MQVFKKNTDENQVLFYSIFDTQFKSLTSFIQNKQLEKPGIVYTKPYFLPYLSIEDNLFLHWSLRKRKEKKYAVLHWLQFFKIDKQVLHQSVTTLSSYEAICLQLIQCLVIEKQQIILYHSFVNLRTAEIQQLLSLIKHINKKNLSIFLFTNSPQLANSPYFDQKFSLEPQK